MYGLDTLKNVNQKAELKHYMEKNPLVKLKKAEDALKSKDYSAVNEKLLEAVTGMKIIKDFFVDSSGFGSENEPALTANQFLKQLQELIDKSHGDNLYSCLSGVGQFQVYVLILKESISTH